MLQGAVRSFVKDIQAIVRPGNRGGIGGHRAAQAFKGRYGRMPATGIIVFMPESVIVAANENIQLAGSQGRGGRFADQNTSERFDRRPTGASVKQVLQLIVGSPVKSIDSCRSP